MSSNNNKSIYFADEEQAAGRLQRKAKEAPFMVIGEKFQKTIILAEFSLKIIDKL